MNEPKLSFPADLIENDSDKVKGLGARSKKEPQMNWDRSPVDISAFLKKESSDLQTETKRVEWQEPVASDFSEKEKLLNELLQEKDKTIAAKDEIIVLQRKLIEQLLKDR